MLTVFLAELLSLKLVTALKSYFDHLWHWMLVVDVIKFSNDRCLNMRVGNSQLQLYFQVLYIKVRNLGVLHKIKLGGDHQILTFGFMQLFDMMQPGGAMMTSTTT